MGKEKDDKNKIEIVSAGAEPGTGGGPVKREESREQQRNEQYNQYVEQVTPKANCLLNCVKAFITGGCICTVGQILTVLFLIAIVLQNLALMQIGITDLPDGTFEMGTLVRFAGYSFLTSMPVLSFMLLISSRFENMWIPLGVGVAGFLSGMALASSNLAVLMVHPFVLMLKPAVAMSAQPDMTVSAVSLVETILFLAIALWLAKSKRYE